MIAHHVFSGQSRCGDDKKGKDQDGRQECFFFSMISEPPRRHEVANENKESLFGIEAL
jgi:hypothetical protein